jgi:spermidine synthase
MTTFVEAENGALQLTDLELTYEIRSPIQHVQVFKHPELGHVLVIDGELQHVEAWSFVYHEPIVHLPLSFIKQPKKVLILGGGDFFAAFEALKYASVEEVVLCDHDGLLIEAMKAVYPQARSVLSDPRFKLIIGDARQILCAGVQYDLLVNDCFDFVNHFDAGETVYKSVAACLSPVGICSDMVYRHIFDQQTTRRALHAARSSHSSAAALLFVPEYPCAMHLLTMWGPNKNLRQDHTVSLNEEQALLETKGRFQFFSPKNIPYHMYLPPFLRRTFHELQDKSLFEA